MRMVFLLTLLGLQSTTGPLCLAQLAQSAQSPQEAKPAAEPSDAVFRSESSLVELHVTVKDPTGKLIMNLPQTAFQILENEKPQTLSVFRQEDAPVSLGLIIDNSESMGKKRAQVAAAALALVRSSNPQDEVFLINFNEEPKLVCDFTQNISTLEAALQQIEPNGATAMRDALELGIAHMRRHAQREKKVLLVVSDGEDNSSQTVQSRLIRDAQNSGILIYSIGLLADADTRERARAQKDLDSMTLTTGGEVFYPKSLDEVDGITKQIARDLRHQYTIAYRSTDQRQDGGFRKVKVVVSGQPGAVVKTRDGYFAGTGPT